MGWSSEHQATASPALEPATQDADTTTDATMMDPALRREYVKRITRAQERPELSPKAQLGDAELAQPIDTKRRFLTADLNVRTGPDADATLLTVLDEGATIAATGRTVDGWAEVSHHGRLRWVSAEYLSAEKPEEDTAPPGGSDGSDESDGSGALSDEPCASGSEVEEGLVANAIAVHRAVCAEFPEVTSYGGLRPGDDGEHGTGQALDIMIPDSATGDAIAAFVQDNYEALGVSEIIWEQQIWSVERASEGWRWMEDRGSDTANHYDHVHVTVY